MQPGRAAAEPDAPRPPTTPLSTRDLLATTAPFVLLALALLVVAYWVLDPSPPRRVVLATGTAQGAYAEFGKRYAELLKADGIQVELRTTQGSAENLKLLRDPHSGVDLAFVQGGADRRHGPEEDADAGLVSLGSMFYEPVWLFYREDARRRLLGETPFDSLAQLPGWRINIGVPGSGIAVLTERLIEANHLEPQQLDLARLGLTPGVVELLEGRLDAMVFVSAPESLMVQMLLRTPGIGLRRLRAGRGLFAPLRVHESGHAAARRGRPRARHAAARRAPGGAHRHAGGARQHASGADPAVRAGRARRCTAAQAGSSTRAISRTRATPSGRWPPRPSASTAAACRSCSATCRSGWPTCSSACGRCW